MHATTQDINLWKSRYNGPVRWSEIWLKNTVPAGLLWEENTVAAGSALCSCESNQPAGAGLQTSEHERSYGVATVAFVFIW